MSPLAQVFLLHSKNLLQWEQCMILGGESPKFTQTDFFKKYISDKEEDFTPIFEKFHFQNLFTSSKVVPSMIGNYNCNYLYRQSKELPHILVLSSQKYLVYQPLGEPGRDVTDFKIGHLMITQRTNDTTLNDMLPLSREELDNLIHRADFLRIAYTKLKNNDSIATCGELIIQRAESMGLSKSNSLQDLLAEQIYKLSPQIRTGRPGYKLVSKGMDISNASREELAEEVKRAFHPSHQVDVYIQGTSHCSQLMSHLHGFIYKREDHKTQFPLSFQSSYISVKQIAQCASHTFTDIECTLEPEPEDEGYMLCRTNSCRPSH